MVAFKVIFNRKSALGYAGLMILSTVIGIIGLGKMIEVDAKARLMYQTHRCLIRMRQTDENARKVAAISSGSDTPFLQTAAEWKNAKDRFLFEFKKLSQSPGLDAKERRIIQAIEDSWKGYDASFHKYVLARRDGDEPGQARLVKELRAAAEGIRGREIDSTGCEGLFTLADASLDQTLYQARTWINLFILMVIVFAVTVILLVQRQVRRTVNAVCCPSKKPSEPAVVSRDDDLVQQGEKLRDEMRGLTAIVYNPDPICRETVEKKDPPTSES